MPGPRSERPKPCPEKASLENRPPISSEQALSLEGLFQVMANDTRLRMLHAIARQGEIRVTDLAEALDMKPQAVSNQLQRLSDRGIVGFRREGNNTYYRIVDSCVIILLERGLCLIEETAKRKERGV